MEEYFKARPTVTPAVAGMTTMTITAAVVQHFAVAPSIVALVVAFLFGLLAWSDRSVPMLPRAALYVVYSITIFSVAVGINETAASIKDRNSQYRYEYRDAPPPEDKDPDFLRSWF